MITLPPRRVSAVRGLPGFPYVIDEYATEIGNVAVYWSLAEELLSWIIHALIDQKVTEAGAAITTELSATQRVNLVTTLLASVRDQSLFDEWCIIESATNTLRGRRNDIVHGTWVRHGEGQAVIRTKARGRVTIAFEPVAIGDVRQVKNDILDLVDALGDFMGRVITENAHQHLRKRASTPPLTRDQSPAAQSQTQARAQKRALKDAHREASRKEKSFRGSV